MGIETILLMLPDIDQSLKDGEAQDIVNGEDILPDVLIVILNKTTNRGGETAIKTKTTISRKEGVAVIAKETGDLEEDQVVVLVRIEEEEDQDNYMKEVK